jgi:hypothetical protein
MSEPAESDLARARNASAEEIPGLLHDNDPRVLAALLENPQLDESHLCVLLERKDLPEETLDAIACRKDWLRSHRLRRALVFHVNAPRLAAMRVARELYLMDLVHLSLRPTSTGELRRLADELILARVPQLPLGQKLALARRASGRVAGSLLAEGHAEIISAALENAFLTEAQVLKVLARETVRERVVAAIARHRRWSQLYNVRLALLRSSKTPVEPLLSFLPDLSQPDLEDLAASSALLESFRPYLLAELARRRAAERSG